jgi:GT2 family glycosyltransferase
MATTPFPFFHSCGQTWGFVATDPTTTSLCCTMNKQMISLPNQTYDIVGSIVLFNTPSEEISRAIDTFFSVPLRTHLCVIDNSPRPTQFDFDRPGLSYARPGRNLGYGRAHNLALRAARQRTSYNLVMNTDIVYEPSAVLSLYEFLQTHLSAGLAAPKLVYPDGSLQYVCRLLPRPANLFLRRFLPGSRWAAQADELYELRFWDHDSYANLPYFQGSFLLLRTELCNRLGGFDERFFMYGEDIDLCRRVYEASAAIYVPEARVVHEYRRYSKTSWSGTWIGVLNNARYFNKWGWFFDEGRRRINARVLSELMK